MGLLDLLKDIKDEFTSPGAGSRLVRGTMAVWPAFKEELTPTPDYSVTSETWIGASRLATATTLGNDPNRIAKRTMSDSTANAKPATKLNELTRVWDGKNEITIAPEARSSALYMAPKDGKRGSEAVIVVSLLCAKDANCEGMDTFAFHGSQYYARLRDDHPSASKGKIALPGNNMLVFDERQKSPVSVKVGDTVIKVWEDGKFVDESKNLTAQIQAAAIKEQKKAAAAQPNLNVNPNAKLPDLKKPSPAQGMRP